MAKPTVSEMIFITLNHNITLTGKAWLLVVVFLRIPVLLFAGYPLYQDEQERFVCNTIQPGCANVCYDIFAPLSLFRFWLVQLTTLCLPLVMFVIYVIHKVSSVTVQTLTCSTLVQSRDTRGILKQAGATTQGLKARVTTNKNLSEGMKLLPPLTPTSPPNP
ncbi:hypothetical protein DNTS_004897 [Danionella cerebrum]|uniref:Connexin N-terminal domain-containing protein n=1 Tax=Danionella cerebrum TaxID=2873325 RepID=A0A553MZ73_9TELE|nr:hypothetical protein DNTS_004897 [Danionella translucida]